MDFKLIMIFILVVVILYFIFNRFYGRGHGLTGILDAKIKTFISNNDMNIKDDDVDLVNYSYSIWSYVVDWNYNYGSKKPIFQKEGLEVFYAPNQNDLVVKIDTYDPADATMSTVSFECGVSNIPIQKWTNIIVSVNGKSIDIYINGKLVKTCVTANVPKNSKGTGIILTDNNGYSGYTSRFKYISSTMDPKSAWDIYKKGWDESNIFSLGYDVDVVVSKDGKVIF